MDKLKELKDRLWELHGDLQSIVTLIEWVDDLLESIGGEGINVRR